MARTLDEGCAARETSETGALSDAVNKAMPTATPAARRKAKQGLTKIARELKRQFAAEVDKAAEVAKKSLKEDKTLREVVREMGLMSDDELDEIIDFAKMTAPNVG